MGKSAILAIRIIGDASNAVGVLEKTSGAASRMQSGMDKASKGAGIALGALAVAAKVAGDAASEAEQAAGAVDSTFGKYAGRVHEYAANAAQAVGLAKDEYGNLASVIGSQLKNMGVDQNKLSGQTDDLIKRGADLAATFGGSTSDAVSALSSLLRGERDPIERYGVSIKQADIDAQKAAMGLGGLTGEADKAATTQATLALLTKQTASATGQFGREADTASGQQQRANAEWQNAQIQLGEQLLPIMSEGAKIAAELAKWMGENSDVVTVLAAGIGILAGGILVINGAMKIYAAIQAVQTAAQWANNAAWLASPVTWIVLAVVAAIALIIVAVVLVIQHWNEIADVAAAVWGAIVQWIMDVARWLNLDKYWKAVVLGFQLVGKIGAEVWDNIVGGIKNVIKWIQDAVGWFARLFGAQTKTSGKQSSLSSAQRTAVAAPQMLSARAAAPMMLSRTALATDAPTMSIASTPTMSLTQSLVGSVASSARPTQIINNNFKTTVNGAIDPDATARTVRDVMTDYQRENGGLAAAGETWL